MKKLYFSKVEPRRWHVGPICYVRTASTCHVEYSRLGKHSFDLDEWYKFRSQKCILTTLRIADELTQTKRRNNGRANMMKQIGRVEREERRSCIVNWWRTYPGGRIVVRPLLRLHGRLDWHHARWVGRQRWERAWRNGEIGEGRRWKDRRGSRARLLYILLHIAPGIRVTRALWLLFCSCWWIMCSHVGSCMCDHRFALSLLNWAS